MTQQSSSDPPRVARQTYDEIYLESWAATIQVCKEQLDDIDYKHALQVKNIDMFRQELDQLRSRYSGDAQRHVIALLYPALDNYDRFATTFVKMMEHTADVSMLWGLLYLVIKLSLESKKVTERVTRMLEQIGHKLKRLHLCSVSLNDYSQIKGDMMEIHREMIMLWLNIIMTFRQQEFGMSSDRSWERTQALYEEAMSNIGDAVTRIEHVAELVERQVRLVDMETLQSLLKNKEKQEESQRFPCHTLPVAENKKFFGRKDILREIEEHLRPAESSSGLKSLAMHGLGGVGKTQIALAYGYAKLDEIDAVFWIPAEQELALQQGFTKIAIEGLHLEGAKPQGHQENMLMVMNWLQHTDKKWLLIFDNVENHQIFNNCWPVSKHGAILVTTRPPAVASQPIDKALEIKEFSVEDGAEFLLQHLSSKNPDQVDKDSALEVSRLLNGYALALGQMAAYISARSMSIKDFVRLYRKYPKKLHRERRPGWKYLGYDHAVDTVWDLSFDRLDDAAMSCVTLMSFMSPDGIPEHLFKTSDIAARLDALSFCEDELKLYDAVEQLTAAALVRYDAASHKFAMHRLVQQECLFRVDKSHRQRAFDAAVKLLHEQFPRRGPMVTLDHLWEEGGEYLIQIAAIANHWRDSQQKGEPLLSTQDLCDLMVDAAWFVQDNDPAGVMSLAVDCARHAYQELVDDQKDKLLYADILELSAIHDLHAGDYESASTLSHQALEVMVEMGMPQDLKMSNYYNYIALALDSLEKYDEAKVWHNKKEPILSSSDEDLFVRLSCQHNLNSARNLYCVGKFNEAEQRLHLALGQATRFNSWYSLGYVHETYASLYSRNGELEKAQRHVELAREVLGKDGGFTSISWISGLCAYRASCVAILRNQVDEAIEEAQKAVAFGRLYRAPLGSRARSAHVLAKALRLDPGRQDEAEAAKTESQRLRRLIRYRPTNSLDDSDHAFEILVSIIQR